MRAGTCDADNLEDDGAGICAKKCLNTEVRGTVDGVIACVPCGQSAGAPVCTDPNSRTPP